MGLQPAVGEVAPCGEGDGVDLQDISRRIGVKQWRRGGRPWRGGEIARSE